MISFLDMTEPDRDLEDDELDEQHDREMDEPTVAFEEYEEYRKQGGF